MKRMSEPLNDLGQLIIGFGIIFGSFAIVGLSFGLRDYLSDRAYNKRIEYEKQFNKCSNCQGLYSKELSNKWNNCPNCRYDII